jgi:hypothetical protein
VFTRDVDRARRVSREINAGVEAYVLDYCGWLIKP